MKDSENKELQDYLNGSDKVSATYQDLQALQEEKPSAALDDSILQAARESVAGSAAQKKTFPTQAYSIAASVCVAVLVGSIFLNNQSELTRSEFESLSIPVSDMPAVEMFSAEDTSAADLNAADAISATEQLEPASRIALPAPQLEADALEAPVFSSAAELRLEASAQEAQISAESGSQEELLEGFGANLQEGQVTNLNYRQNIETWLLEIQRLSDSGNETELAEERRLFTESYPDIDIDSALIEVQLSN